MNLKTSDLRMMEAVAAVVIHNNIAAWATLAAVSAGVALPLLPVVKLAYLLFAFTMFILLWVKVWGETWAGFGLIWPASWGRTLFYGFLLVVAQLVYSSLALPVIEQTVSLWTGAGPNKAAQVLGAVTGNLPLFLILLPVVWIFAAFGEEVFYRGYLMSRFAQFMGEGKIAWGVALVAQAVLFGIAHLYQGPAGAVGIGIGALISGLGTLVWGRNLWPAIIAHGVLDTLGFTLLYLGKLGPH